MPIRFVSVVGGDTTVLAHSIDYYRWLGVDEFHVIRHVESLDDQYLASSRAAMRDAGMDFVGAHVGPWHIDLNAELIRTQMRRYSNDWWVVADLDEFHVYDRPLNEVIAECDQRGFDYIEGALLDRVASGGELTPARPVSEQPLFEQYPLAGLLTLRLLGGCPSKITLARGSVYIGMGQHTVPARGPRHLERFFTRRCTTSSGRRQCVSAWRSGWRRIVRARGGYWSGASRPNRSDFLTISVPTAGSSTLPIPSFSSPSADRRTGTTHTGSSCPRCWGNGTTWTTGCGIGVRSTRLERTPERCAARFKPVASPSSPYDLSTGRSPRSWVGPAPSSRARAWRPW